jgi:hypothetical protein
VAGLPINTGSGPTMGHFLYFGDNSIVTGVGITRTPTCVTGDTLPDPYLGSRFRVGSSGGGDFRLVASVSGGRASSSGGAITTGGGTGETSIGGIELALERPASVTYVTDWAGAADY